MFTLTTGLSFGSLQTSGGALAFSSSVTNGTNVIGTSLTASLPAGSTLWSSYLVRLSVQGGAAGDGAVVRIGNNPGDSSSSRFTSWADSRDSSKSAAVGYTSGGSATKDTTPLSLNTTYIIISKFTNVGTTLSVGSPGVATLWALTETQFTNFVSAGSLESFLTSETVTATAMHTVSSGSYSFSGALTMVAVNDTGVFDELRFGTSLADVTPVPEPASIALLAGLASASLFIARRRRA